MKIERLVLDTNVVISAALDDGSAAAQVVDHAVQFCQLVGTQDTVKEIVATLFRSKFDRYVSIARREDFLRQFERFIQIVPVIQTVTACRDSRDDKFLEAAVNGRADAIISGDKDLTSMHPCAGIDILTPAVYMSSVKRRSDAKR